MEGLLRLLPAGAFAGWDLHPLENAALSRRTHDAGTPRRSTVDRLKDFYYRYAILAQQFAIYAII